jgi:GNAT superfamily N-acetyltransferase
MIRDATVADIPKLLQLMQQLAEFEGYADRFTITERDLFERGFSPDRPSEFSAIVSEDQKALVGYAVIYIVPFTFDLRPTVVLKELFVEPSIRSRGIGSALFSFIVQRARASGARLIRWQVLTGNESAMRFYQRSEGHRDSQWEHWVKEL